MSKQRIADADRTTNWGLTSSNGTPPKDDLRLNRELSPAELTDDDVMLLGALRQVASSSPTLDSLFDLITRYSTMHLPEWHSWIDRLLSLTPRYCPGRTPDKYKCHPNLMALYIVSIRCGYWRRRANEARSAADVQHIIVDPFDRVIQERSWTEEDFMRRHVALIMHTPTSQPGQVAEALNVLVRIAALVPLKDTSLTNLSGFLRDYDAWVSEFTS